MGQSSLAFLSCEFYVADIFFHRFVFILISRLLHWTLFYQKYSQTDFVEPEAAMQVLQLSTYNVSTEANPSLDYSLLETKFAILGISGETVDRFCICPHILLHFIDDFGKYRMFRADLDLEGSRTSQYSNLSYEDSFCPLPPIPRLPVCMWLVSPK